MNVRLRVLRDQLRQILYWRWDPVGASDAFPHTIDEYDSYIWPLLRLLSDGADAAAINQHLRLLERDHIGAGAGDERRLEAAELIVSWYSVA